MSFKKGDPKPKNSGRKKGTPNKVTAELREFFIELLSDPVGRSRMIAQYRNGTLSPQVFTLACYYVAGKPKETIAVEKIPPMLVVDELSGGE